MQALNMIGLRYGRLTVKSEAAPHIHPSGQPARQFNVRCDCGTLAIVRGSSLRIGAAKSCGCFKVDEIRRKAKETDHPDMVGERFGRILVLRKATDSEAKGRGPYRWYFISCDCGTTKLVAGYVLRRGGTVSCGCFSKEQSTKHGHARPNARTPEYGIWCGIIKRCENPNSRDFKDYGGRGITMCKRWRASYMHFFNDMGPRPTPKHSIDRIKNDAGYSPSNCQWATPTQQARNRRKRRTT